MNGRIVGPLGPGEVLTENDFLAIEMQEMSVGQAANIKSTVDVMELASASIDEDQSDVRRSVVCSVCVMYVCMCCVCVCVCVCVHISKKRASLC